MKHLLITGFDPFGGDTVNPSWEAVKRLPDTIGGYELIKHDFSAFDFFDKWGMQMKTSVTDNGWSFRDRSRTSAEIYLDFARAVRESAGDDCIIIVTRDTDSAVAIAHRITKLINT